MPSSQLNLVRISPTERASLLTLTLGLHRFRLVSLLGFREIHPHTHIHTHTQRRPGETVRASERGGRRMTAPSRAAARTLGRVLVERHRHCAALAPVTQQHGRNVSPVAERAEGALAGAPWAALGGLRDEVGAMTRRGLPVAASARGCQLQLHRGFLGIGDGDEDIGLAKHFEEDRVIGYTPEQVFDVVAGVDLYEDFVPWCQKSKILWRTDDKMDAELEIGFKLFVERYISHVELKPPNLIKTTVSQSALFDFLNNEWHFKPGPTQESCHLFFVVDFQFKSPLYRRVANMFFNEVQARLVGSFEERCQAVYGPSMETVMR